MRIIIKPLGMVVMLVSLTCGVVLPRMFPSHVSLPKSSVPVVSSTISPLAVTKPTDVLLNENWGLYSEREARAVQTTVPVSGKAFPQAYHFDIQSVGKDPWNIGFHNRLDGVDFTSSNRLQLSFWARSDDGLPISILMQQSEAPYTESWRHEVPLSPQWKKYEFSFDSATYAPGGAYLSFLLGRACGSVELADIHLLKQ